LKTLTFQKIQHYSRYEISNWKKRLPKCIDSFDFKFKPNILSNWHSIIP